MRVILYTHHIGYEMSVLMTENVNIGYIKMNCTLLNVSKIVSFFFSLSFPFRCVLLFRPPRLNSKFEENAVKYTQSISYSSLRTFIRDNV